MVCLGFKPRPQGGRRRQNHGAMAATHSHLFVKTVELFNEFKVPKNRSNFPFSKKTSFLGASPGLVVVRRGLWFESQQ